MALRIGHGHLVIVPEEALSQAEACQAGYSSDLPVPVVGLVVDVVIVASPGGKQFHGGVIRVGTDGGIKELLDPADEVVITESWTSLRPDGPGVSPIVDGERGVQCGQRGGMSVCLTLRLPCCGLEQRGGARGGTSALHDRTKYLFPTGIGCR